MKQTNENFQKLSPEQQREIREESELYIEQDPRAEHLHTKMGIKNRETGDKKSVVGNMQNAADTMQNRDDRGPSAEKNMEYNKA